MSKFSVAIKRFGGFLKRNAFYFLVVLCIASIATVIALAVTYNNNSASDALLNADDVPTVKPEENEPQNKPDEEQKDPVIPEKKLTFNCPVNGSVSKDYSDNLLVWNSTMGEFAAHLGVDFTADDGKVYASADGTVKETGHNDLDGYYVILQHADGYQTCYKSLKAQPDLKTGASVSQGDLIGEIASSQGTESKDGDHLHFEIWKNDEAVDPLELLVLNEK